MKEFGEYLNCKVEIICKSGKIFKGEVMSFGDFVQGEEEYGRAEAYICVYTGDTCYVLFQSEIQDINEEGVKA